MLMGTKCKNCTKYEYDCGHHLTDEKGHIIYDCPRETCCDRMGNCEYYEEVRNRFQIQIDLINEGKIRQISTGTVIEALRYAMKEGL